MKTSAVIMDQTLHAGLQEVEMDDKNLAPDELLVKTLFSLVSAGTELAIYKGTEKWAPFPYNPGYAAVAEVSSAGSAVSNIKRGDLIFCYSGHRRLARINQNKGALVKLPAGCNLETITFTRLAAVAITALRVCPPELGDWAAIFGMGLVGNLAAQLFALSGANVIGIDIAEKRLAMARQCGLRHTLNPEKDDLKKSVLALTNGQGVQTAVEATGVPAMVEQAFPLVARRGDVVLLGSPRGQYDGNITDLLNKVHLWGNGCVSLKGAHEWRYPVKPSEGCKHSLQRNCEILVDLIADGRLLVKPLISHVVGPDQAQQVYQGLLNNKEEYLGVVFDWNKC